MGGLWWCKLWSTLSVLLCLSYKTAAINLESVSVFPPNVTTNVVFLVPTNTVFAVIQIHSQHYNLSLSTDPTFPKNAVKSGTSVGMTTFVAQGQTKLTWYVRVMGTSSVQAVVSVQPYTQDDPVPGGCNQVFSLENDSSIILIHGSHRTNIWFQWSNLAAAAGKTLPDCENKYVTENLLYDIYVSFLPERDLSEETFLANVQNMGTVEGIQAHSTKVYSLKDDPSSKSQVLVTSQAGQGAFYSVVVTRLDTGRKAAYVTAATYACNFNIDCFAKSDTLEIIFAVVLGACGLFLLTVGHRWFKTVQVVFGFTLTSLVTYILMSLPQTLDEAAKLGVSAAVGVIGGGLWLVFWHCCLFPITSVFVAGLCAGYLVASTLFFTPFGNITWWSTALNYAMAFTCITILFAVILMAYTRVLSIVSCGIAGAFMLLMSFAIPMKSSLRLLFLNAIYHQTEEGYNAVKIVAPFFTQDIVLLALWPCLALLGAAFQFYREKGRSPFPLPDRHNRISVLETNPVSVDEEEEENDNVNFTSESDDERRRLLPQRGARSLETTRPPTYQSISGTNVQGTEKNIERNFLT